MPYRALVIEFLRKPYSPLDCLPGSHWTALIWNEEDGWVGLRGRDFGKRIDGQAHWRSCDRIVDGDEPYLSFSARDSNWVGTDGEGDISPKGVIGECPFLTLEAERDLRALRGTTCELIKYTVRFDAQVKHWGYHGQTVASKSKVTSEILLLPTEIIGVRLTVDCDGTERTNDQCPRKERSPS